ncbi:2OG-Fe(II) oxygenase [Bordetella genomosp. 11]|uniref:Proline hydroxylase n=1 Tax=Bordetella genomosp. 11 TaxID=1416808 RepID=A0A261UDX6_9BORD|nr:2OG-Fe(II) oxygenase [Bordetella genomosp. 11]OZI60129.1 proline hydroxylase [Bordetella genomosp. 11]
MSSSEHHAARQTTAGVDTPRRPPARAAQPSTLELDTPPVGLAGQDWAEVARALDDEGCAVLPGLLSDAQCDALAACYDDNARFRSRIVMSRHGFGRGEYQYFAYPLPGLIQALREQTYAYLAPIANRWNAAMGNPVRYPPTHAGFLRRCHQRGQARPTPLLLRYGPGDYNCLHQDLYGEHVFPLQIAILLSRPGRDYAGGEFVLTEQRPRMQSRVEVVPLDKGDAVVFAVNERPVQGTRGVYRVKLRHGVSRLREGRRHVMGVIFHDAA